MSRKIRVFFKSNYWNRNPHECLESFERTFYYVTILWAGKSCCVCLFCKGDALNPFALKVVGADWDETDRHNY